MLLKDLVAPKGPPTPWVSLVLEMGNPQQRLCLSPLMVVVDLFKQLEARGSELPSFLVTVCLPLLEGGQRIGNEKYIFSSIRGTNFA